MACTILPCPTRRERGSGRDPFTGVQSDYYWTSTTDAGNTSYAWFVYLGDGDVDYNARRTTHYVWPVRGGQ